MKGLITAGGQGTRMRPLTFSTNKHFIPLANKPLLFYAIEEMQEAGIREIGINYNPGQLEEIKRRLGTGKKWRVKFNFILQEKAAGLADIVRVSRQFLGKGKFVMHLGDNIFFGGIKELVDYFKKSRAPALLTIIHHPQNKRMGVPYFKKTGKLFKVVEKPSCPPHNWAVPGLYFFDERVFGAFLGKGAIKPSLRGELEIGALYNWLLKKGGRVETGEFTGIWRDPGKFDDWLSTNQFLLDQLAKEKGNYRLGKTVRIEGRVQIGKGVRIANSLLRGPIIIGQKVEIKDSFIGPYTAIGDECQISKTRIENSVLCPKVKIENPLRFLDSCLIGEETVIVSGSKTTSSELFLGNNCYLNL